FRVVAPPFDLSGNCDAVHAPDGSAITVVTADGSLRVCDMASGRERDDLRSHSDGITAVAFTPDSKMLLLASRRGGVRFWDLASGRQKRRRFSPRRCGAAGVNGGWAVRACTKSPARLPGAMGSEGQSSQYSAIPERRRAGARGRLYGGRPDADHRRPATALLGL